MNTHVARGASLLGVAAVMCGAAALGTAAARADSVDAHWTPDGRTAVYLSDVAGVLDVLPVCAVEDCSDQPGQIGVWTDPDTGDAYIEFGESVTLLVDDDTAAAR